MKFDKILGKCDPQLIQHAEERLSATFIELAMGYKIKSLGSRLGGDIFLHQLVSTSKQICDARAIEFEVESKKILEMHLTPEGEPLTNEDREFLLGQLIQRLGKKLLHTAATDGKAFYWAPQFIVDRTPIGLRLVVGHEGLHTIYMHPSRRGSRNKSLWNIAVDFKVNFILMDDLRLRKLHNAEEIFQKELGDFITLQEYTDFIKDPFNPPAKLAAWNPLESIKQMANPGYADGQKNPKSLYYAEPKLSDDFKKPEVIYEFIWHQIPKCGECGKVGVWKKPEEFKKLENQLKEKLKDEQNYKNQRSSKKL